MKKLVPGHSRGGGISIAVPEVGHRFNNGSDGIVARSSEKSGTAMPSSVRDLIARYIKEIRRVYPDVTNSTLKEIIARNKLSHPEHFKK